MGVICKLGGWRRRVFCVVGSGLLLVGPFGENLLAQPSKSWSAPLSDLKQTLEQLKVKSIMQEQLIESLQIDNAQLKKLSTEQQDALQRQQEMLNQSQSSLTEVSASWTSYLQTSEEAIQEALASARRNRLVWQIGIPVAMIGGAILGILVQ